MTEQRIFNLASALIAASPAITVGQAILVAVKVIELLGSLEQIREVEAD